MMTPAEQAYEFYGDSLYDKLDLHLLYGYVFSTPEYFAMLRPVDKDASLDDMLDISKTYSRDKSNCWCIYFVSGNINEAWNSLPFSLPYCCFEHKGNLKFYLLEKLKGRIRRYYGIRTKNGS